MGAVFLHPKPILIGPKTNLNESAIKFDNPIIIHFYHHLSNPWHDQTKKHDH
jgi:hypothetical protein